MYDEIDFGSAFHKINGNAVKVTVNNFNGKDYLHIREYMLDGDTGRWIPTKTGYSMPPDEVTSLIPLLEDVADYAAQKYMWSTQLELDLENDESENLDR